MTSVDDQVKQIGTYFSKVSKHFVADLEKFGLKKHTEYILNYFEVEEINGLNVLEMGCGIGGLLLKLLQMGAERAVGLDLSEEMIKNARSLAQSVGLSERITFLQGDFNKEYSQLQVSPLDIIIADRVYCCSPVAFDILERTLSFHPQFVVIVLPRKNPLFRKLWDLKVGLRNFGWGVKRPTKSFYYPSRQIINRCKEMGYSLRLQRFRYVWEVLIFKRG